MKKFKTIDEQIKYLESDKLIEFDNDDQRKLAAEHLLDTNYYNIINGIKKLFVIDIRDGKHIYKTSKWNQWLNIYMFDEFVSKDILGFLLIFEKQLNSRLCYLVSKLINDNLDDFNNKNLWGDMKNIYNSFFEIKRVILKNQKSINCTLSPYTFNETWRYISTFTFGNTLELIKYFDKHDIFRYKDFTSYHKIISISDIKELKNLRNTIGHFTPLSIWLIYGSRFELIEKLLSIYDVNPYDRFKLFNLETNAYIYDYTEYVTLLKRFNSLKNSK